MPSLHSPYRLSKRSQIVNVLKRPTEESNSVHTVPDAILSFAEIGDKAKQLEQKRALAIEARKKEINMTFTWLESDLKEYIGHEAGAEKRIEKLEIWKAELWEALQSEKPPYWSLETNSRGIVKAVEYNWTHRSATAYFEASAPKNPPHPRDLVRRTKSAVNARGNYLQQEFDAMIRRVEIKAESKELKKWSKAFSSELKRTYGLRLFQDNVIWDTVYVIVQILAIRPYKLIDHDGKIRGPMAIKSVLAFVETAVEELTRREK